jgi:tetratricopeptide (TPR) repeat protein
VSPGRLRSWMLLALALLVLAHPGFAGSPAAGRCDREKAKTPFSSGMWNYGRYKYQSAIPFLEEAVNFCPTPSAPWTVQVALFGETPYTPLYYLGKSHYNLKDLPAALRNFYLASCFDENKRHEDKTADLASLTETCRNQVAGKDRSQSHPHFQAGLSARNAKKWEQEAEKMWDALHVWTEDGGPTNTYGRWHDPYLPQFRLAEALFELGCYREAVTQMDRSRVGKMQGPETEEERQRLAKLKPECEQKIHQGDPENEICQRWQCLLK